LSNLNIPLSDLDYGEGEKEAVLRVLASKWLSMGAEVQAFEREFAEFVGAKHAFAVSNATAALHLSYLALKIGAGDEIVQPALNFVACANMTIAVGATPILADVISVNEPTIDPAEIERLITPQTKAVVVMHYGGYLCRMAEIQAICQQHNIPLIEDACHAVGASYLNPQSPQLHGKKVGSLGDIACFSFFSNKNLVTGEGGMVTTDRDDLADRIRLLRSHGMTTLTWERHKGHASSYDVVLNGYNYRFDEIRAALGRVQLGKLLNNNKKRQQIVDIYRQKLADLPGWVIPFESYAGDSANHLMTVLAPNPETRAHVVGILKSSGIQTSLHYPCVADFQAFDGFFTADNFLSSREFAKRVITLPLFPGMSESQVERVCDLIRQNGAIL
jgi:dTDP-4-amino-4,6-dideoxygalactose transaminase